MGSTPCPFCNRTFGSTKALLQHQRESLTCSSAVARAVNDGSIGLVDTETERVVKNSDAAAALGGAVLVGSLVAGAAALGVASLIPKAVERYTLEADKSSGEQKVEEVIVEFERKLPFKGFSANHLFPNEPKLRHGNGNGLALASKEDLLLPAGWAWADEWNVAKGASANKAGTDPDGWMYAFNWGSEYVPSPSMTHCVRQRNWVRTRISTREEVDGNPVKEKQSSQEPVPSGGDSALKELFEKNGLADIFQRAAEELGLKAVSDLKLLEKEDLDALQWLTPIAKRKFLRLMAETLPPTEVPAPDS